MEERQNKLEATLSWDDHNVGIIFKEGSKVLDWDDFSREEQMKILNGFASLHNLFSRFIREQ